MGKFSFILTIFATHLWSIVSFKKNSICNVWFINKVKRYTMSYLFLTKIRLHGLHVFQVCGTFNDEWRTLNFIYERNNYLLLKNKIPEIGWLVKIWSDIEKYGLRGRLRESWYDTRFSFQSKLFFRFRKGSWCGLKWVAVVPENSAVRCGKGHQQQSHCSDGVQWGQVGRKAPHPLICPECISQIKDLTTYCRAVLSC